MADQKSGYPVTGFQAPWAFQTPWALIITIAIVAIVEWNASRTDVVVDGDEIFIPSDRAPTLVESIVDAKLNVADQIGQGVDVLVLGDSSGLMGVDPSVVAARTGKSCYNLCTISLMGVQGHRAILDRYLERHGNPSVIIYHFAPNEMRFTEQDLDQWKFLSQVKRWLALRQGLAVTDEAEMKGRDWTVLPSQKFRSAAQSWLSLESSRVRFMHSPRGNWPSHSDVVAELDRGRGFMKETSTFQWDSPRELELVFSDHHQATLRQLMQHVNGLGIQMVIVANPLPELARTTGTDTNFAAMLDAIEKLADSFPKVTLLFPQPRYVASGDFATLNHLRPEAVVENTVQIIDQIDFAR
jgi:hypothetical protein